MEFLESFARKYGGVVIAGVVGAIIRRIRENMTLIEFLQVIFLGVFVSYCVGVAVEEYFDISEHFKYVIGAVSAIYSKEVLDTQRKLEDDTFAIREDSLAKQLSLIDTNTNRELEDAKNKKSELEKILNEDKTLTTQNKKDLND